MPWIFENGRPIYTQILEQMEQKIISGEYKAGEKLPSVRELATQAAVNPNTMQRAMAELENRGLVITNRTSGRTVTEDKKVLKKIKEHKAKDATEIYISQMKEMGFSKEEIIELIKKGE